MLCMGVIDGRNFKFPLPRWERVRERVIKRFPPPPVGGEVSYKRAGQESIPGPVSSCPALGKRVFYNLPP